MRSKFILFSMVASSILFTINPLASKQKHDLTIIYTNDVLGEIEPCG